MELATEHDIAWKRVLARKKDAWSTWHTVVVDTGHGPMVASADSAGIWRMEYYPSEGSGRMMLPPWKAYPRYWAGIIGWRMGSGEAYAEAFRDWFGALSQAPRNAYQAEHPPPEGWEHWLR